MLSREASDAYTLHHKFWQIGEILESRPVIKSYTHLKLVRMWLSCVVNISAFRFETGVLYCYISIDRYLYSYSQKRIYFYICTNLWRKKMVAARQHAQDATTPTSHELDIGGIDREHRWSE